MASNGIRIHHREARTHKAEHDLREFVRGLRDKHDLSDGEMLRVVSDAFGDYVAGVAKFWIREERHPGKPERPGGLE